MPRFPVLAAPLLLAAAVFASAKDLEISILDVEGGKAMLLVSPSGDSMLVDAGWPASRNRPSSTDRIVEAVKAAGLSRIDFLLITHFDIDHIGDVPELSARLPIGHILDRGDFRTADPQARQRYDAYAAVREKIGRTVLHPGDKLPLRGVDIEVLAASGRLTARTGPPNPLCTKYPQAAALPSDVEDDQSIGVLISYGPFRMLDLADLEAHPSHDLVCPDNRIGAVDVYNVNVHGQFKGIAPELVGAIRAPVVIQANGPRKGADAGTWPILRAAPGSGDIWQLHFSLNAAKDQNPPADFIANLDGADEHRWLQISVASDGAFRVENTRNGFTARYRSQTPR